MIKKKWIKCFLIVKIAAIGSLVSGESPKTIVPLFLFSGQSNMVGLGTNTSQLSSEEKEEIENIKINNVSDQNKDQGKWKTFGPGFGSSSSNFGPELFFGRVLADSMPDKKMAFIKNAMSGTYLGQSGGWLPPSSGGPGTLYGNMMKHIGEALESFNDAFDTSLYTPKWAGFIWHQGEFDAMNNKDLADKYEVNLTNLIKDIREMAEDDSLPVIIPMISQGQNNIWQFIDIVHEAEIAVAEKLHNCDTTKIIDYNLSDIAHYDTPSMKKIGTNCALRWLAMDFTDDWWDPVPVVYQAEKRSSILVQNAYSNPKSFDLSGRMVRSIKTSGISGLNGQSSTLMLIKTTGNKSEKQFISKTVKLR
ncbi:MAG: sialate O-acetylesterase [Fibrobacter sp.]|nr:sialate O-acetylesterase [Fibrobacter sp.]